MGSNFQKQQQAYHLLLAHFTACDTQGKLQILIRPATWLAAKLGITVLEASLILSSLHRNNRIGYTHSCKSDTCEKHIHAAARNAELLTPAALKAAEETRVAEELLKKEAEAPPEIPPTYEELTVVADTLRADNARLTEDLETARREVGYANRVLERDSRKIENLLGELKTTRDKLVEVRKAKRDQKVEFDQQQRKLERTIADLQDELDAARKTDSISAELRARVEKALTEQ